jgi:hypothetical protein
MGLERCSLIGWRESAPTLGGLVCRQGRQFNPTLPHKSMKTITIKKTRFGRYAWTATANVNDDQLLELAADGLLWQLQRTPSSNAEKAFVGKRVKGFKRTTIPFTSEGVELLRNHLEANAKGSCTCEVAIEEHVPTVVEPKFARAKAVLDQMVLLDIVEQYATKIGFVDFEDAEELNEENVAFLAAITKTLPKV